MANEDYNSVEDCDVKLLLLLLIAICVCERSAAVVISSANQCMCSERCVCGSESADE